MTFTTTAFEDRHADHLSEAELRQALRRTPAPADMAYGVAATDLDHSDDPATASGPVSTRTSSVPASSPRFESAAPSTTTSPSTPSTSGSRPPQSQLTRFLSLSATDTFPQYVLTSGGKSCTTAPRCVRVQMTVDGGSTWQPTATLDVETPEAAPTGTTVTEVRFASDGRLRRRASQGRRLRAGHHRPPLVDRDPPVRRMPSR